MFDLDEDPDAVGDSPEAVRQIEEDEGGLPRLCYEGDHLPKNTRIEADDHGEPMVVATCFRCRARLEQPVDMDAFEETGGFEAR